MGVLSATHRGGDGRPAPAIAPSACAARGGGGGGGGWMGIKPSGEWDGSRLLSKAGFNLSLLIINSCSRIACRDLDLPLSSGSGCPSATHLKYLMFDVSTQICVP